MNPTERPPKTFVFGAAGFVGSRFLRACRAFHADAAGADLRPDASRGIAPFDLASPQASALDLGRRGFTNALVLAGVTGIDQCERRTDLTRKANVAGTLDLIRQLAEEGIKPVFASSDYVFDGTRGNYAEDDPTHPTTEYGRQKAEVEARISALTHGRHLVVRLGKVFSLDFGDGSLLDEMACTVRSGGTVRAAYDQVFCPILVDDLIRVVFQLLAKGVTGLVNVCSREPRSRYGMASDLARAMGANPAQVARLSIDEICPKPPRPHNTSLNTAKLQREVRPSFTPWEACIERVASNWEAKT